MPDTFASVAEDQMEDVRAVAKSLAAANFPITLQITIRNARGFVVERWTYEMDRWKLHCGAASHG